MGKIKLQMNIENGPIKKRVEWISTMEKKKLIKLNNLRSLSMPLLQISNGSRCRQYIQIVQLLKYLSEENKNKHILYDGSLKLILMMVV